VLDLQDVVGAGRREVAAGFRCAHLSASVLDPARLPALRRFTT
jgi:hypothetical protein